MRTYDSKRWYVNLGLTILTAKPKGKCIHFSHYFIFQLTTSFAFPLPKELPFEEINEKENVNFYRGVHGKKLAFTVWKTKIEFKENGAFYKRLPTFCVMENSQRNINLMQNALIQIISFFPTDELF